MIARVWVSFLFAWSRSWSAPIADLWAFLALAKARPLDLVAYRCVLLAARYSPSFVAWACFARICEADD